jgi:hypothetical protein
MLSATSFVSSSSTLLFNLRETCFSFDKGKHIVYSILLSFASTIIPSSLSLSCLFHYHKLYTLSRHSLPGRLLILSAGTNTHMIIDGVLEDMND